MIPSPHSLRIESFLLLSYIIEEIKFNLWLSASAWPFIYTEQFKPKTNQTKEKNIVNNISIEKTESETINKQTIATNKALTWHISVISLTKFSNEGKVSFRWYDRKSCCRT